MRARCLPLAVAALLCCGVALAQDDFQQFQDLLDRGLYNSAALVAGPELIADHPQDRRAHALYARALLLSGDIGSARGALDSMLALGDDHEPQTADELQLAGLILAEEGNAAEATALLARAFGQSGFYVHAMDWGRLAWQSGDSGQAEEAYRAAADTPRGQREPWPWLDLGRLLLFQGRLDEAEAALEQAIAVYEAFDSGVSLPSPAYVESFYRLGQLAEARLEAGGETQWLSTAIGNYQNALVGDPNYVPAQKALARLLDTEP